MELKKFADVAVQHRLYHNPRAALIHCNYMFEGVDRFGTALDVGGGTGLLSFYMAARGGRDVTCLEPELDGSTSGVTSAFNAACADMGFVGKVRLERAMFQDYDASGKRFDVIVTANAINHLDEEACVALGRDPAARERYLKIFGKFYNLLRPGGHLVFSDCSRHNLFPLLGLTNPLMPMIEWDKHQSPYVWRDLAMSVGFAEPRIAWTSYSRLGRLGRLVMGNPIVNHLTLSSFRVTLRRPPA